VKYCFAINLRFISQGELKRIVKLKSSSNFGTKWLRLRLRLRLRISRGNSYELNNQSLLSRALYILTMKKKMFSSRATGQ